MVVGNNELTATKNGDESLAISIAMVMQRNDAGHITQWSTSGAYLEATGCHHRSTVPVPYHPGGRHGQMEFESNIQNTNKKQLLASNYGRF
jgi:hypothetical protein